MGPMPSADSLSPIMEYDYPTSYTPLEGLKVSRGKMQLLLTAIQNLLLCTLAQTRVILSIARLPSHSSLIFCFSSLWPGFALSFLQIPSHDGHPCSQLVDRIESDHSELSPPKFVLCPAHNKKSPTIVRLWDFFIFIFKEFALFLGF
jgi:hypothetical protein